MISLEERLKPLRERWKKANEWERKGILLAVDQIKKEFKNSAGVKHGRGVDKDNDTTFKTAEEVFGKI